MSNSHLQNFDHFHPIWLGLQTGLLTLTSYSFTTLGLIP